jgi:hypothetical protein
MKPRKLETPTTGSGPSREGREALNSAIHFEAHRMSLMLKEIIWRYLI